MSTPPTDPKVYHITHVANLGNILGDGGIVSDAEMIRRGGPAQAIGMSGIKRRRVEELVVPCHPPTMVGDYVSFYFCPRSIMLYVIYCANHPDLIYRGGQGPIVYLEADLHTVVDWAEASGGRWAFSLSNAGARCTEFRAQRADLGELDWAAIGARDFRLPLVKEGKQAEFLTLERFPIDLVERIGVRSRDIEVQVEAAFSGMTSMPK